MLLAMSMIACNYAKSDAVVVGFMSLAFFGKGVGALGWAVVSDTSPKEAGGCLARCSTLLATRRDYDGRSSSATSCS